MFRVGPVLMLLAALLAVLAVTAATNSAVVLDTGHHDDVAKEVLLSSYSKDADEEPVALGMLENSSTDDDGTGRVLTMPYFPWVLYLAGVSLSLIDVSITGLDQLELPSIPDLVPVQKVITIPVSLPYLELNAGSYVAGGGILNLPFVATGTSPAQIDLTNLGIVISFEVSSLVNFCPKPGSLTFEMTLDALHMDFQDLNPGQDSGDLINSMLNSVTDDVTKWINLLFNQDPLKTTLEHLIGVVISSQLPYTCSNRQHPSDYGQGTDNGLEFGVEGSLNEGREAIDNITKAVEKLIQKLSAKMEVVEDVAELVELFGELLPEMSLDRPDFVKPDFEG